MRRKVIVFAILFCAAVVVVLLMRRSNEPSAAPRLPTTSTRSQVTARLRAENAAALMTAPVVETNRVEIAPEVVAEINRLIAAANPLGVSGPITAKDIISRVDYPKGELILQTKTHSIALSGNRLSKFVSELESSNPIARPEAKRAAMQEWHKATSKWSKEEALAETERIIARLGIQTRWETREVEATELTLKNPQGEPVTVTPFYIVNLSTSNATLRAEFRMGESGPGRLTEWYMWPPMPSGK